ncbi:MAG: hypothetical protein C4326_15175 [Ignavibacteria bacterium]
MRTSRRSFACALIGGFLFLGASQRQAQSFDWSVIFSGGEILARVALTRITPDSLIVTTSSQYAEWVHLDSLLEVRRERRGALLPAALIGGASGGVIGYAIKPTAVKQGEADVYSVVFGVVIGGAVGFLIGSHLESDEVFDLRSLDRATKLQLLQGLVSPLVQNNGN